MFGQVEHARALLQELVGESTARLFDWSTLRLEPGSYIDERLRGSMSELHHIPGEPDPPLFMDLHMIVRDIDDDSIPHEQLTAVARASLRLLRAAAIGALVVEHAKPIADWITEVHGDCHDDDFEAIVTYILQASKEQDLMRNIYQYVSEKKKDDAMSIADWLRADGRAEGVEVGRAEGEVRGTARLLLRLLARRFDTVPRDVRARIRSATLEELERWAMRVLEATAVDEVFVEP